LTIKIHVGLQPNLHSSGCRICRLGYNPTKSCLTIKIHVGL